MGLPEFDLSGKVAIVTGGGRSLGRGAATVLAEAGADVVVVGRSPEPLDAAVADIEALGRKGLAIVADVSDVAAVDEVVRRAVETFGHLDVMVANAGVFQSWAPSEDLTNEEWEHVLSVNLTGAMNCNMAAGKQMIAQGTGGSIVNISSIQGLVAIEKTVAYTASKHGLMGVTKCLGVDWAPYGVRVNAIAPGFVQRDVEPLQEDPSTVDFVTSRTPLARWGTPRELGMAVLFLASPASSYVTGTVLAVDGGWTAH